MEPRGSVKRTVLLSVQTETRFTFQGLWRNVERLTDGPECTHIVRPKRPLQCKIEQTKIEITRNSYQEMTTAKCEVPEYYMSFSAQK